MDPVYDLLIRCALTLVLFGTSMTNTSNKSRIFALILSYYSNFERRSSPWPLVYHNVDATYMYCTFLHMLTAQRLNVNGKVVYTGGEK